MRTTGVSVNTTAAIAETAAANGHETEVQADSLEVRHPADHVGAEQAAEEPHAPCGQHQSEHSPDTGQDERFRRELQHEPRRRGAERIADGDLPRAAVGARQQQADDVDAGDHEQ